GVWWLILFNRKSTREVFAAGIVAGEKTGRPLSVSIIGWWNLMAGAMCLIPAAIRMPAFVVGFVLTGAAATLVYVVFGALSLFLGWGLLNLDERARIVSIGWFGFSIVHTALVALVPSVRTRMWEFQKSIQPPDAPQPPFDPAIFSTFMMVVAAVVLGLAIWLLVRAKPAFH